MVVKLACVSHCCREFSKAGCSLQAIDVREVAWDVSVPCWTTFKYTYLHTCAGNYLPTFDVASVKLFNVVDFPLDGYVPLHG